MKISKATREEAANLCNAMAWWWEAPMDADHPEKHFGVAARWLANKAVMEACAVDDLTACEHCLEAEALIREGWTP